MKAYFTILFLSSAAAASKQASNVAAAPKRRIRYHRFHFGG